jgi:hypothetical protein
MGKIKEYYLNNLESFSEINTFDYEAYENDIKLYQQEINEQEEQNELALDVMWYEYSFSV